jgi:hypothetical protein
MIVFSHTDARIKLFYDNSMTLIQENQTKYKKNITKRIKSDLAIGQEINSKISLHQIFIDFIRGITERPKKFNAIQSLLFFSIFKKIITIQSTNPTKG